MFSCTAGIIIKLKQLVSPTIRNVHKVKCHPSLQKGGCHEVHDIEDLIKVGKVVKGLPYNFLPISLI